MNISLAAKSSALQSLVSAALSNPGELHRHLETLVGLQLLIESCDETDHKKGAAYVQAVESLFSTAFRIAGRPQVRRVGVTIGLCGCPGMAHPQSIALRMFKVPRSILANSTRYVLQHNS